MYKTLFKIREILQPWIRQSMIKTMLINADKTWLLNYLFSNSDYNYSVVIYYFTANNIIIDDE